MTIFRQIYAAMTDVIDLFFADDTVLISREVRKILSNKEDAKKYNEAISQLKYSDRVEITLSTGETIILIKP